MSYSDQPSQYGSGFMVWIGAYGLSRLVGVNLWVPAILVGTAKLAVGKARPKFSTWLQWVVALVAGEGAWMLLGALLFPAQMAQVALDIVVGFAMVVWLLVRPSRAALAVLVLFELAGLAANLFVAYQIGTWTPLMAALLLHIAMRLGVLVCVFGAWQDGPLIREDLSEAEEVFS